MVDLFHSITVALGDTRDVQLVTERERQEEGHRVASDVYRTL